MDKEDRDFILEFLDVYRTLPALWDANCNDYKKLNIKNAQYDKLLLKYQEKYPKATKRCLSKKISILRINYRREVRRRKELEKIGKKVDDSDSNLYYFDKLDFIRDIKPPCYANSTNKHKCIHKKQSPQQPTDPKEKFDLIEKKNKMILALKAHLNKSTNDHLNKSSSNTLHKSQIDSLNESSNDYLGLSTDSTGEPIAVLNETLSDCLDFTTGNKDEPIGNLNESSSDYMNFTIDIKEEPT